ncbi:MaoC family dehydratase [Bhargavaea cecembensis]|uniref:MaoC family dehydratase n=1 Tax=Bhargavaea cecembensis TaxID=394098 RepID=UPI00058D3486|nr:MaoC/PaaZ C-terminal domain-containing protein [Bhargavaea cecembensis]
MIFNRRRVSVRPISELTEGESLRITEKIDDRDLLLYLGLTNDSNPLYIQHDFARAAGYESPVVPAVMLTGIVFSSLSKHLPGPGARVLEQHIRFPEAARHESTLTFRLEINSIQPEEGFILVRVDGEDEGGRVVMEGEVKVAVPVLLEREAEISALGEA